MDKDMGDNALETLPEVEEVAFPQNDIPYPVDYLSIHCSVIRLTIPRRSVTIRPTIPRRCR